MNDYFAKASLRLAMCGPVSRAGAAGWDPCCDRGRAVLLSVVVQLAGSGQALVKLLPHGLQNPGWAALTGDAGAPRGYKIPSESWAQRK